MKLLRLTPMLRTWDMPGSLSFYTTVLGFTCEVQNDEAGWASLKKDELQLMLAAPNHHQLETVPAFTGSLYFECDNVDQLWLQLKDKAGICYEPETFDYGMREFAIYDNNGYLLQFGQEIDK